MRQKLHSNQSGLVSIVVSMILIMVLSLIVLSFARLTLREQRQVLDHQLNTQAFYAAETGVNDATRALLEANPGDSILEDDDNDCDAPDDQASGATYPNQLEGTNVIYSCLLIDPSPTSLEYDNIDSGKSKVFPLELKPGETNTTSVSFFWQTPESTLDRSGCNASASNSFPPVWPANCSTGILRIDILSLSKTGAFGRNDFLNNTATIFAVPNNSAAAGSTSIAAATGLGGQGAIVASGCDPVSATPAGDPQPKHCEVRVTGLDMRDNNAGRIYYVRLVPLYKAASVTVCTPNCGTGAQELINAQAVVDSTGRASDVLRRIQVRVGTSRFRGDIPLGAIETNRPICKRLLLFPPGASDDCGPLSWLSPTRFSAQLA